MSTLYKWYQKCDVNNCDLNISIFVTDNFDNCAECDVYNVNNVENNSAFEDNDNFLISSKHSVEKVSTNSVNINSNNGGTTESIPQANVSLTGLAPPRGDGPSFVPHAKALVVAGEAVERFLFLDL